MHPYRWRLARPYFRTLFNDLQSSGVEWLRNGLFTKLNFPATRPRSGVPRVSGARGGDGNWRPLPPPPPGVSDWQAPKVISFAIGGSGAEPQPPSFLEYLGVNETHFWIASIPFSTRRVRLTSAESALPCYRGGGGKRSPLLSGGGGGVWSGVPASNALGAFGCEWNPFLNCVNTIFNSASDWQAPKALSLAIGGRGSGAEPQPPTPLRELK